MKRLKNLAIAFVLVFSLVGCTKCINIEYKNVEVTVVDEYYQTAHTTPVLIGKVWSLMTHPAVYKIVVEYDGVEYSLYGSEVYYKYKDKVGENAIGILKVCTYDDGNVKCKITSLE